jgi:four helix bundle protein
MMMKQFRSLKWKDTMSVQRFEDLNVWQRARSLSCAVYRASSEGAFRRDFGLRDQIRRASVSVMSNIAEGFGRYGAPEMHRFTVIALGSLAEVRSQLYLALDLHYLDEEAHRTLLDQCMELERRLLRFRASIGTHSTRRSRPGSSPPT